MLTPFGADLWLSDGPALSVLGFVYPTRMGIVRLPSGGLFLWSPSALTPALRAAIVALGQPAHIVAPNHLHHMFLADWAQAFPRAMLHAAPGLPAKRPEIGFHADLSDTPHPDWAEVIDQVLVPGNRITTECVFFHRARATVLVTDLLQQFRPEAFSGWRRLVARLDGMIGPEPAMPRKFRLAFTDRRAARPALARILAWPAERLAVAHGAPVERDAAALLARAFGRLAG